MSTVKKALIAAKTALDHLIENENAQSSIEKAADMLVEVVRSGGRIYYVETAALCATQCTLLKL